MTQYPHCKGSCREGRQDCPHSERCVSRGVPNGARLSLMLAIGILVVAAMLVGCGGGDPDDDTACPAPELAAGVQLLGATVAARCQPREAPPPTPCSENHRDRCL